MLVCERCGDTIREDELGSHDSFLADLGDYPVYENVTDTCSCGGDYVEGYQCKGCGCWFTYEQTVEARSYDYRLCKACLAEFRDKYKDLSDYEEDEDFIDFLADEGEI